MRIILLFLLLLSGCGMRLVISYETEEATQGKMNLQKDQENEKIIVTPSLPPSGNSI